jgi:hypothetical protein
MTNRRGQGTYNGCYLSLAISIRENGLHELGDLALPLLHEACEKLLELSRLLDLPTLFSGLSVRLEHLVPLLWDLLQSHHDDVLWINLRRHV